MADLLAGQKLAHFRIEAKLGEGGMGVVYRATDEKLRRPVALKVLPEDFARDDERRRRFLREARSAAAVTHANIATVYEVGEVDGRIYIAMELVEGESLRQRLGRGPLEVGEAVRIARDVARGLARAHEKGIVHRDLKPDNVIVATEGEVKVLDFGLAKMTAQEGEQASATALEQQETASQVTQEGRMLGTPAYMSPEQALGRPVDARTDVFALGVCLYEMLAGKRPFGGNAQELLVAITRDEPEPLARHNPRVPAALEALVARSLAKDPARRYASAREVVRELEALELGSGQAARTPSSAALPRTGTQSPSLPLPDGLRLDDGRYVVRGVLGEGAQGTTYDAVDTGNGRPVAIKRFDVRGAKSWKDVELAERETRVLATLDHPLVPRYVAHFEQDGALYLVMEKVEGETLESILRRQGPLPEDEVRRFLACADRALTYLHGRASPIIHRDIKPRNVVRRPDGSYVLVDFGTVSELMRRGRASTIAGTIGYMAPEQLQGRALSSTDVYAVGATALAGLTGVEPENLPHRGLGIDVRAALEGRTSPAMVTALEQMLEPDPDRRPTSLAPVLDGVRSETPSLPVQGDRAAEDTLVKSIRGLLWLLWGLGWVLVPLVLSQLRASSMVPVVMFGSLAVLLVLGWQKSALLRVAVRAVTNRRRQEPALFAAGSNATTPRARVEVSADPKVRVHGADLPEEEMTDGNEAASSKGRKADIR
jgi:serine/threonine protein kinase